MQPRWLLSHARGYIELGLLEEATAELAQLPPDSIDSDEALALRMEIFRAQSRWIKLRLTAGELTRRQPANADAWITFAYATRRAESLHAAEAILRAAELRHPHEPTIQFNLGCYACQRGDLAEARRRVDAAIALEPHFKIAAQTDPDLAALRAAGNSRSDCPSAG
jgi:tetratricopeptide (TPR) repeat protein